MNNGQKNLLSPSTRHGGAVIIVVLSLLTTLLFLGLFFYNWTSQEVANAQNFSKAEIGLASRLNPNPIFDVAAEQLIVGTKSSYTESALWGGLHSMLAHEIGRIDGNLTPTDSSVGSGQGIVVQFKDVKDALGNSNPDGYPDVDSSTGAFTDPDDYQFVYTDANRTSPNTLTRNINTFILNYGRLAQANPSMDAFNQAANPVPYYRPDVGYTYPDVNSLFLAHEELATDPTNAAAGRRRVLIPSFFRPQLFPTLRSSTGTNNYSTLYTSAATKAQVFRPHQSHLYPGGDQRYLTAVSTPALSGDRTRILGPFPFPTAAADAQMGVFTNASSEAASANYTLLDVDLDGDGIKDAIWIDLGLPIQELTGDQQFVPLASFKVVDADGLLNLNSHGNIQGAARLARTYTGNEPFSVSNLGMARSEVNPLWALSGDVSTLTGPELQNALQNTADQFGFDSSSYTPGRLSLANMEFLMMLTGWKPSSGETEVLGRYGERDRLLLGNVPRAGQSQVDDEALSGGVGDNNTNGGFGQPKTADTDIGGKYVPGFVHPLSPIGMGAPDYSNPSVALTLQGTANGATRVLNQLLTQNPATWPQYANFLSLPSTIYPAGLMLQSSATAVLNMLQDEDDETVLESGNSLYGMYDEPFAPSDSAFLQLSDSDQYRAGISSRLASLASANFQHVTNAAEIRRQFTTDSWDRLEFNFSAPLFRQWEWGTTATNQFPPQFNLTSGQVQPFRQEMRSLFRTDFSMVTGFGSTRASPRHRLNLNRVLSNDQLSGGTNAAFVSGSPRYRNLVPHPDTLTGDKTVLDVPIYHGDSGVNSVDPRLSFANLSGGDTYVQEWWARYDRQRMARDIYCLLWVLGGGNDNVDFTTTNPYTSNPEQAREMAQFAVNVVDGMDRDSNITCFQYDANLTDGWDTNTTNLSVVYGVEHQELAFNEVLFIKTVENTSTDAAETEYDEKNGDYYHSFVELRNAAPWQVRIDDACWRIRRIKVTDGTQLFTATLKNTAVPTIAVGGEYLISCQDGADTYGMGGNMRPSDFRMDANADNRFEAIVPNVYEATAPDAGTPATSRHPLCDHDLMHSDHSGRVVETAYTTATSLLNTTNLSGETNIRLVLERRLRPDSNGGTSNALSDTVNPWVEVDRVEGTIRVFNSTVTGLDQLKSQERRGPFDSGTNLAFSTLSPMDYNGATSGAQGLHTLPFYTRETSSGTGERRNYRAPTQYTIWQPHFDRDYSSSIELLSVPLYGVYPVGIGATWSGAVNGGATRNVAEPGSTLQMSGHRTASIRMMFPQDEDDATYPVPSWFPDIPGDADHYQNRWYRLLEFVTVKSQDELRMDPITAVQRRTAGKVNLNTIRHEAVFAGLVDDPYQINPRNYATMTQDLLEGSNRRWYVEHKRSRDGFDPFLAAAAVNLPNVTIPGGFYSRPFRPLGYLERPNLASANFSNLSVQSTILRMRPQFPVPQALTAAGAGHGLYEARISSDIGTDLVDYHTRNRLLAKIANNSTTRSHVFFVWMGLDFFEAHQNGNGNIQIGAKADSAVIPSYRMFCVVDMSRLEEAYDPTSQTFDFRKFIIHRQLLP